MYNQYLVSYTKGSQTEWHLITIFKSLTMCCALPTQTILFIRKVKIPYFIPFSSILLFSSVSFLFSNTTADNCTRTLYNLPYTVPVKQKINSLTHFNNVLAIACQKRPTQYTKYKFSASLLNTVLFSKFEKKQQNNFAQDSNTIGKMVTRQKQCPAGAAAVLAIKRPHKVSTKSRKKAKILDRKSLEKISLNGKESLYRK